MLDVLGHGYVVDCCVAVLTEKRSMENWQNYLADAAAAIINMFAGRGKMPRYWDMIHEQPQTEETADDIIADIITRFGLKVVSK